MSVVLLGMLVLGVAAVAVVVALGAVLLSRPGTPPPSQTAAAARRHAAVVSGVAWGLSLLTLVAGGPVATAATSGLTEGVALGLVPAVAGVVLAAVHAVGELTWPRPTGTVRRAGLVRRTVADVAPRRLHLLLRGWAATLVVVLLVCGLVADDRQVTRTLENGATSAGPFPGWFYGVPLLVATLVVLGATEGVLHLVARRPAVVDARPAWDLSLRRLSAHRVLRGGQLVLGLTTAGVLAVAGSAVHNVGTGTVVDGVAQDSLVHAATGTALLVLALASGAAAVAVALVPGRPATVDEREPVAP